MSSIRSKIKKPRIMKTVLFTDGIMYEDDHARTLSSSVVQRKDYPAMAQMISSGTSNTCNQTVSVLKVHERSQ